MQVVHSGIANARATASRANAASLPSAGAVVRVVVGRALDEPALVREARNARANARAGR